MKQNGRNENLSQAVKKTVIKFAYIGVFIIFPSSSMHNIGKPIKTRLKVGGGRHRRLAIFSFPSTLFLACSVRCTAIVSIIREVRGKSMTALKFLTSAGDERTVFINSTKTNELTKGQIFFPHSLKKHINSLSILS